MNKEEIIKSAQRFTQDSLSNYISEEAALSQSYIGMKIYDPPLFAFGPADDEIYLSYSSSNIIGEHFVPPLEWLPTAKTIITFFLPYTERIRSSNAVDFLWPSEEWLHGRIEGQLFIKELSIYIQKLLSDAGYESLIPALDPRFIAEQTPPDRFTSNWSERHAAFACGLGTFGLSKGIITEKGMCGRLGSLLTDLEVPYDCRPYSEVYEYCSMCGACIPHCPVDAISLEEGKEHLPCFHFLNSVLEKNKPRYGCGKCQVKVPCEQGIPSLSLPT